MRKSFIIYVLLGALILIRSMDLVNWIDQFKLNKSMQSLYDSGPEKRTADFSLLAKLADQERILFQKCSYSAIELALLFGVLVIYSFDQRKRNTCGNESSGQT
jgi:hypothetical protein